MVEGSADAWPVKGLRIMAYGTLAEIVYGHVQKGSRIGVEGHLQIRERANSPSPAFEIVAEHVEFLRNIDYETGKRMMEDLRARGRLNQEKRRPYPLTPEIVYEEETGRVLRVE